jgi:hypothetical protein
MVLDPAGLRITRGTRVWSPACDGRMAKNDPMDEELRRVAADLYALDPSEFTAARDARAAETRQAGDRELAAAVKGLRRPSAAAAALNLLARERPPRRDPTADRPGRPPP